MTKISPSVSALKATHSLSLIAVKRSLPRYLLPRSSHRADACSHPALLAIRGMLQRPELKDLAAGHYLSPPTAEIPGF